MCVCVCVVEREGRRAITFLASHLLQGANPLERLCNGLELKVSLMKVSKRFLQGLKVSQSLVSLLLQFTDFSLELLIAVCCVWGENVYVGEGVCAMCRSLFHGLCTHHRF